MADSLDWLNQELFDEFLQMRKDAKLVKANTDESVKRLRNKLEQWYHMGYNIDAILEHAIENQWRGLWIPKGFEPNQRHLKSDLLSDVNSLVESKRMPQAKSSKEQQEAAQEARRRALELVGANK